MSIPFSPVGLGRWFLGSLLMVSALLKALSMEQFAVQVSYYGLTRTPWMVHAISFAVVAMEMALGIAVCIYAEESLQRRLLPGIALLLLLFSAVVLYAWEFHDLEDCGCFGRFLRLSPGPTIAKNFFLVLLGGCVWLRTRRCGAMAFEHGDRAFGGRPGKSGRREEGATRAAGSSGRGVFPALSGRGALRPWVLASAVLGVLVLGGILAGGPPPSLADRKGGPARTMFAGGVGGNRGGADQGVPGPAGEAQWRGLAGLSGLDVRTPGPAREESLSSRMPLASGRVASDVRASGPEAGSCPPAPGNRDGGYRFVAYISESCSDCAGMVEALGDFGNDPALPAVEAYVLAADSKALRQFRERYGPRFSTHALSALRFLQKIGDAPPRFVLVKEDEEIRIWDEQVPAPLDVLQCVLEHDAGQAKP